MAERDPMSTGTQVVLTLALLALLSSGVINILLAVTESALWPLLPGVGWPLVAAVVTSMASTATPPRLSEYLVEQARAGVAPRVHHE